MNLTIFQYAKSNTRVGLKLDNAVIYTVVLVLSLQINALCALLLVNFLI